MWEDLRLAWRLWRDERVSALKYALPALAILYAVSPVDVVPDLILGIGQVDDLGALTVVAMMLVRVMPALAPDHVVEEHLRTIRRGEATSDAVSTTVRQAVDARFRVR